MLLRPQVQLALNEKWKIRVIAGIPIATANHLNRSGFLD